MSLLLACLLLLPSPVVDDTDYEGPYHIEVKPLKRVEMTITQHLVAPAAKVKVWGLGAGLPPTFEAQKLNSAQIYVPSAPQTANSQVKEGSALRQLYLFATWNPSTAADQTDMRVQAIYDVTLFERTLVKGKGDSIPFPLGAARTTYLDSTAFTPHGDPDFRKWMGEEGLGKLPKERDLKYAYRVLVYFAEHLEWKPDQKDPKLGPVVDAKGGTSSGLVNLYNAVLRASGIPARALVGRVVENSDETKQPYNPDQIDDSTVDVESEFYAEGVGWVPVDIVAAMRGDVSGHFGVTDGTQLVLNFERMLLPKDKSVDFQGLIWDLGKFEGAFDGATVTDKVEVEEKKL